MSTRVFVGAPADPARVGLDAAESHYLRRVRRVGDGARIEAIDDHGGLWLAEVVGGDARGTTVKLLEQRTVPPPPREIVVLLGMPEPATVLDVLPGLCEVGVAEVVLVRCARSQGAAPGVDRIARVLRAAQRQCGRPRGPAISGPVDLREATTRRADLPGLFAWEELRATSSDAPAAVAGVRVCVGPEGGFTPEEAALLRGAGFRALGLGPYTLRTETAALVAVARAMFA
ncbi:RsmE family RNA methyltransferase [Nannocystis punicea]|uniref:Ribosomal RNA small subunit methyltransferase E n=1 Tax=Nannocystis punicea TaxID=2995304 RepID=A0ABY7HFV9_9BACT|nr:16S rRNA (uracil(1498)-N(3))-methyltransferase [Nannocystis poenicansa]WAS98188.1 16S rRNA (uracil(1498)-N(3))-methyltransferase [Nannocystis poenicansa]